MHQKKKIPYGNLKNMTKIAGVIILFAGIVFFGIWISRWSDSLQKNINVGTTNITAENRVSEPVREEPRTQAASTYPAAATPVPPTDNTLGNTPPRSLKWGFYAGWEPEPILALEQLLGKSPDHIAVFIHWGNENQFPARLSSLTKDRGKTLIIFWEATDYTATTTEQPRFSYDAILRGDWDAYMRAFAADAQTYGAPVVLIPFSEMNGDWFPWSGTRNGNTPEKAILAYRHVHDMFTNAENVKFGWAPNNDSFPERPENSIEKYYPGDTYVDYVGVNGFNFGDPWQTFDEMFRAPLALLATYNKPIYIFSFASAAGVNKPVWVTETFTKDIFKYPKVEGWIWFNENKERDWRIDSEQETLTAFKAILP